MKIYGTSPVWLQAFCKEDKLKFDLGLHTEKNIPTYSNTCMFLLMAPAYLGERDTDMGQGHCFVS